MAWKWYPITSYRAFVGSEKPGAGYGDVALLGTNFYGLIHFLKSGPMPAATSPVVAGQQRFYGYLEFPQMATMVDLLRHEGPVQLGWDGANPSAFRLATGNEPTGEDET